MKIFAFRFGISFEVEPKAPHPQFESVPFAQLEDQIPLKPDFPGQMFYTKAGTGSDFADQVFALHTRPEFQEIPIEVVIWFEDAATRDEFTRTYVQKFKKQEAAGGLVVNPDQELLLIERHGLWDLPKGKLEKKESIEEGAWREVAEECGLEGHTVRDFLVTTYHIFERRGKWRFKPTHWYWMETKDRPELTPQAEEAITQAVWVSLDEIREKVPPTYPTIEAAIRELIYKLA